jgi:dihydrofolate reductase
MRRLRYNVAASLDGYIADANGGFDWIPNDPTVDFVSLFARIDTVIMGRATYDVMRAQPEMPFNPGTRVYVVSRTLDAHTPGVTVVRDDPVALASSLRREQGDGEIWLFGGGKLFATLLAGKQVDAVEITITPVLLGGGIPLLAHVDDLTALTLVHTQVYPSGMVALHYRMSA